MLSDKQKITFFKSVSEKLIKQGSLLEDCRLKIIRLKTLLILNLESSILNLLIESNISLLWSFGLFFLFFSINMTPLWG
jgi:hypothetical protein